MLIPEAAATVAVCIVGFILADVSGGSSERHSGKSEVQWVDPRLCLPAAHDWLGAYHTVVCVREDYFILVLGKGGEMSEFVVILEVEIRNPNSGEWDKFERHINVFCLPREGEEIHIEDDHPEHNLFLKADVWCVEHTLFVYDDPMSLMVKSIAVERDTKEYAEWKRMFMLDENWNWGSSSSSGRHLTTKD